MTFKEIKALKVEGGRQNQVSYWHTLDTQGTQCKGKLEAHPFSGWQDPCPCVPAGHPSRVFLILR